MEGLLPGKLLMARLERGLTLRMAAELTGVSKETISELERGLRSPHPPTLYKIAQGYGIRVGDLLKQEEPATVPPKAGVPEEEPGQPLKEKAREWAQEAGGDRNLLHGMDDEAWNAYVQDLDTPGEVSETYHKMQDEVKMLRALWSAHKMQQPQARGQRRELTRGLRELRTRRYGDLASQAALLRARDLVEEIFAGMTEEEMA